MTGGGPGSDQPSLIIKGGPTDGHSHTMLEGTSVLVGSGRLAHFRVGTEEAGVNLAHIKVTWDDTGISVTDNGSHSGTYVNGEQVETAVLLDGDRISFQPPGSKLRPPEVLVKIPPGSVIVAPPLPPGPEPAPGAWTATSSPRPVAPRGGPRPNRARRGGFNIPGIGEFELPEISLPEISLPGRPSLPSVNPVLVGGVVGGLVLLLGGFFLAQRFFFSTPVVSGVNPADADTGATITISGKRFDPEPTRNTVWFGDMSVPVSSGTEESLAVKVPGAPASGGDVSLSVETPRGRSGAVPFTIHTTLGAGALEPEAALPGDEVTVKGQGFLEGQATVTVAGRPAQVLGAERSGLRFKMPAVGQEPGSWVPVMVRVRGQTAKPVEMLVGRLPVVLQFTPPRGSAGDRVTISGRGFGAEPAANAVTFAGVPALVLQATARDMQVLVPPARGDSVQEEAPVVVRAGGKESTNRALFTIVRPAGGAYLLRFFPAAAADIGSRMVFVASEAGPTLLLSSPEGAPSATSRAIKVAAAINGALDQARNGNPVVFEAKREPFPGVGLAGASELIMQATPDDSAAYASPPGLTVRAGVPTLPALADHWAALLNDCLAVFVQNEKPMRLLALSGRGRALLELRSALGWRAGSGIPTEKVATLSPELYQRVREASLFVAGAGQGSPAAAVEGTWEGEMEDVAGPRAIVVRLRLEGSTLSGRLTNQTRALSMEVALRDVSFRGGVLRFTLPAGNATRFFVGSMTGSTVKGTLHATAEGPAIGSFTLKNVP